MWVTLKEYNETYKSTWFNTWKSKCICDKEGEGELITVYYIMPV